jgi:thioredoxin-dependent peroxiredoxin
MNITAKKGQDMAMEIGDLAPDFNLPDESGELVSLDSYRGRQVVLYFYPKDDTSGCTIEAKDFSCLIDDFNKLNTAVIGMSPDNAKSHAKFRTKHELSVTLIADEQKTALQAYDVWKEKSMYGRKYMGVERSTFLIDADGKIKNIWRNVKVPAHAEMVLAAAKA